jgi:hypothetical protein
MAGHFQSSFLILIRILNIKFTCSFTNNATDDNGFSPFSSLRGLLIQSVCVQNHGEQNSFQKYGSVFDGKN